MRKRLPKNTWACTNTGGYFVQVIGVYNTVIYGVQAQVLFPSDNAVSWCSLNELRGSAKELATALLDEAAVK